MMIQKETNGNGHDRFLGLPEQLLSTHRILLSHLYNITYQYADD